MTKGSTDCERENDLCEVLFVDDDVALVNSTVQWLNLSGIKVRSYSRASALLTAFKNDMPAIIVSDIRMPEIDGMQLLQLIMRKDSNVPVILLTGHGDIPLAVEAMKAGAYEFLTKPFLPDRLLEVVRLAQKKRIEFLNKKHSQKEEKRDDLVGKLEAKFSVLKREVETSATSDQVLAERISAYEKNLIEEALKETKGNIPLTLSRLGVPRRTLNEKMKKHGIIRREFK